MGKTKRNAGASSKGGGRGDSGVNTQPDDSGTSVGSKSCDGPSCNAAASSRCGRCRAAFYCSPKCQRAAWNTHKPRCSPPPAAPAPAVPRPLKLDDMAAALKEASGEQAKRQPATAIESVLRQNLIVGFTYLSMSDEEKRKVLAKVTDSTPAERGDLSPQDWLHHAVQEVGGAKYGDEARALVLSFPQIPRPLPQEQIWANGDESEEVRELMWKRRALDAMKVMGENALRAFAHPLLGAQLKAAGHPLYMKLMAEPAMAEWAAQFKLVE